MINHDETFNGTWPFKPNFFNGNGFKQHYIDEGPKDGNPIIMLHGEPTWGYIYRNFIPQLSEKYKVIVPDLMGFGKSETPQDKEYTLKTHVENLAGLINFLDLKNITFVGQDWGGPIGMGALSLSPNLLKGAVVMNTGFNAPTIKMDLSPAHATVKTPIIGELMVEVFFSMFDRLGNVQGDPESWTPEVAKLYGKPLYDNGNAKAPLAMMRMVTDGPSHPSTPSMIKIENYVKTLGIPAEIVWGMNDPILGKALPRMEENFPKAPVTQTDAGHFLQEEVPTEIAEALMRVLSQVKG